MPPNLQTPKVKRVAPDVIDMSLRFTVEQSGYAADAAAIGLKQVVERLYQSGMPREEIYNYLMNDLRNEGRIFGAVQNSFIKFSSSMIEQVDNDVSRNVFQENLGDQQLYVWILDDRVTNHCEDCLDRAGDEPRLMAEWEIIGLPKSGATLCGDNCYCKVEPA
jgi:hypothetical protein